MDVPAADPGPESDPGPDAEKKADGAAAAGAADPEAAVQAALEGYRITQAMKRTTNYNGAAGEGLGHDARGPLHC